LVLGFVAPCRAAAPLAYINSPEKTTAIDMALGSVAHCSCEYWQKKIDERKNTERACRPFIAADPTAPKVPRQWKKEPA
jgi:hypothetical protein